MAAFNSILNFLIRGQVQYQSGTQHITDGVGQTQWHRPVNQTATEVSGS